MANLRQTLYAWRDNEAATRGVELFRILPNTALEEIVRSVPKTREELMSIKGIKDAKFAQFGKVILELVAQHSASLDAVSTSAKAVADDSAPQKEEKRALSVSAYLDIINRELWRLRARVQGEVTSFKFQGSAVYLGLKDGADDSTLNVFMWARDQELSGIELKEGLEIVIEGRSEIYKPSGRFSFRAETMELVGEGALKKAYDALKKKLESEGLFELSRKRALPEFPTRIGLITSRTGAVIHDFSTNLGKFGFTIAFADSRVEGALAVKDILSAIAILKTKDLDALVLIRGGGSLESLQAFNNEAVVRALLTVPVPVICAIGHDKDVPLAQLVADYAPSTPTAAATLLNTSWEEAKHEMRILERELLTRYERVLWGNADNIRNMGMHIQDIFEQIIKPIMLLSQRFDGCIRTLESWLNAGIRDAQDTQKELWSLVGQRLKTETLALEALAKALAMYDPTRQLKLGYSILMKQGKILRSVSQIAPNERFEARLSDGTLTAQIEEIINKSQSPTT